MNTPALLLSLVLSLVLPSVVPAVVTLALWVALCGPLGAQEIGFVEKFALASDREAVLKELIPGTEPYYYYHALHYQHGGKARAKELAAILKEWAERFPGNHAPREEIVNRQALIEYGTDPQRALTYLREKLGLSYHHQRLTPDARPDLPVALDPGQVSREAFMADALAHTDALPRLTEAGLIAVMRGATPVELSAPRRRDLLGRLTRPDFGGLVKLIAEDLATKESRGFGEFKVHGMLTLAQLEELLTLRPQVMGEAYGQAYLSKLRPAFGEDAERDAAVREAWLERQWAFVSRLSAAFTSLKAHVLYHRLWHDRGRGVIDEARLLEYLKLPRAANYVNVQWRERKEAWKYAADLNADYAAWTGRAQIGQDEGLIRDLLLRVLARPEVENAAVYAPWLHDKWLETVLAEAKLLSGAPNAQKWVSLLPPEAYQALKDRTDLDFEPDEKEVYAPADEVRLDLNVKNVPRLLVKVFEINTENVHRTTGAQVNTDLNLDGLTANSEQKHDYHEAPLRRVKRTFGFPELNGKRGVWIVEFIGGGKSSRALLRKGGLRTLVQGTAAGTLVTVLEEKNQPVKKAYALLGPRRFEADDHGAVLLPFSTQPGEADVILGDGAGFTTLEKINVAGEAYELKAGFHVARESLLPNATAQVAIRPALLVNGQPGTLTALEKVRLTIASTNLDGVPGSATYPLEKLAMDAETLVEFSVPERLAGLSFQLEAEVKSLVNGQPVHLTASGGLTVNGLSVTEQVSDLHLTVHAAGWTLEERGRTGEARPEREVNVTFHRPEFQNTRSVTFKTDASGAITLGTLEGINRLEVKGSTGVARSFTLPRPWATLPSVVNVMAGEPVQLAWRGSAEAKAGEVSVLEYRSGTPVRDAAASATVKGGLVTLSGLAAGEYVVEFAGSRTTVRVGTGEQAGPFLLSAAQTLELSNPAPVAVMAMAKGQFVVSEKEKDQKDPKDKPQEKKEPELRAALIFHIGNATAETRVHVLASRFLPQFDGFEALSEDYLPAPGAWMPAWRPSLYQSARTIGEEYRYVLERRNAKRHAGNLLPRPGLLLNPWAISDTATAKQDAAAGEDAAAMVAERAAAPAKPPPGAPAAEAKKAGGKAGPMDPDLSFLAMPGVVAFNLRPDKDGNVAIDATALGDRTQIRVMAIDGDSAAVRDFTLPAAPPKLRDLRLADALDPKGHYSRQDRTTLLEKDVPFAFKDAMTATWQSVGNLAAAHSLLFNVSNNAVLAEWAWVLNWPKLDAAQRAEMYSKYASHELHFFLARKDPEFFKAVVQPFLANKRDKTFMDEFLLGADLSGYVQPWAYSRLNTTERILLARRLKAEVPVVRRHLSDWLATLPRNPQRDSFLFETALNGRVLMTVTGLADGAVDFAFAADDGTVSVDELRAFKAPALQQAQQHFFDTNMLAHPADAPGTRERNNALVRGLTRETAGLAVEGVRMEKEEADKLDDSMALGLRKSGITASRFGTNKAGKDAQWRRQVLDKNLQMFRQTDPTKEWAESNYYRLLIAAQNAELVKPNRFWQDYALWDGQGAFVSANLAEAAGTLTEMLLALAVTDLPFPSEAKAGKVERKDNSLTLTPAGKGILFHQEIRAAEPDKDGAQLLVSQNFYRQGDRYIEQAGEKIDKFVSGEFLSGVVYGSQIVVTNPTSSKQKLDLLFQIPQGAMPVLTTRATQSLPLVLEPYHTNTFDFHFYFPAPGEFTHFPVHLSRSAKTAASAPAVAFHVVGKPTRADKSSWEYVSQHAEPNEVLAFLEQHNLYLLNLDLMAWRLKDADFFRRALAHLRGRHVWHPVTWSYALLHNAPEGVRDYLQHSEGFLARCGAWLESAAVTIDPVERRSYQHLEYSPLVNARAHRLGARRTILNDKFRAQYLSLLRVLTYRPALDAEETLAAAYYLALQDRIDEAVEFFTKVDPAKVSERLQYDYLQAWLAFCQEDLATARRIVAARGGGLPPAPDPRGKAPDIIAAEVASLRCVTHWQKKFAEMAAQLDEIDGKSRPEAKPDDRDATHEALAAKEPAAVLKIENKTVTLNYRNLSEVTVNYYPMDLEFLFSANPFVTQDTSRFRMIRPNKSETLQLAAGKEVHSFPLPREYQSANVLVEVSGGGLTKAEAAYANELDVQVSEGFGRLHVQHAADKRALSKVYVKVFAEQNGTPVFYKDGYTDLRGKFDYASLSTGDLDGTGKFSILILSDTHGATVKEVQPPRR